MWVSQYSPGGMLAVLLSVIDSEILKKNKKEDEKNNSKVEVVYAFL